MVIVPPVVRVVAFAHAALKVRQRAVVARRPGTAVLVVVARPPRAVARAVAVPVAAVVLAAVVVADGAPSRGLGVAVVREGAVRVRAPVAMVVAAAVRVAVAAIAAGVVACGALRRTPVVLGAVAAVPVARAVRVLVAAAGAAVVAGGALRTKGEIRAALRMDRVYHPDGAHRVADGCPHHARGAVDMVTFRTPVWKPTNQSTGMRREI